MVVTVGSIPATREESVSSAREGYLLSGRWVWVLGYTAMMTTLSTLRYHLWIATGWDLGFFQQGLWALYHEGWKGISSLGGYPILADAAAFILLPLAPLYNWFGVGFLFFAQSLSLGLGYIAILRLARLKGLSERSGQVLGWIYLLYPVVIGTNLFDFHPDVFAVPLLIWAVELAERQSRVYYGVLLVALAVKDQVAVAVLGLGIALLIRRRWGPGLFTVLAGAAFFGFDVLFLIPHLLGHPMNQWVAYYGQWGSAPVSGIRYLATHPWDLLAWMGTLRSWEYLVFLFGPLAVLFLRTDAWRSAYWLPVLLVVEANLLSRFSGTTDPFNELSLVAVPFVFAAAADVLGRRREDLSTHRRRWLLAPLLLFAVGGYHMWDIYLRWVPPNVTSLADASARVPQEATVVTQNYIMPHVANRARLLDANAVNLPLPRGSYVLLDTRHTTGHTPPEKVRKIRTWVSNNQVGKVLYAKDGVYLYEVR